MIEGRVEELSLENKKDTVRFRIISSTNFNAKFSLFINDMFVTLLS